MCGMAGALEGKVVVVIGGTTGLGLCGAKACISAGARVVVVGRDVDHVECSQWTLSMGGDMIAQVDSPAGRILEIH